MQGRSSDIAAPVSNIPPMKPVDTVAFDRNDIIEIIALTRFNLYNRCRPCGAKAILQEMESLDVHPLPSISAINRILARLDLTHKRAG